MVGISTIIAVCVTLFISLLLPVIVYIVYGVRNKGKDVWTAWLLGAAGFFVFQCIIRLPLLNMVSLNPGFTVFAQEHYVVYCFILAITAAIFEAAGRFIVAKLMNKKLTYERGIAAGLGHGGIEAIFIIGIMYVNNLIYIIMINSGSFDNVVAQTAALGVDTTGLLAVKDALVNTGCGAFYLAGYERFLTMIVHTALSLLVCYFVKEKKSLQGILLCVLFHCMLDFTVPVIGGMATGYLGNIISQTTSNVIEYLFLTVAAVGAAFLIRWLKGKWKCID